MPTTITTTVYTYAELDERAKERARDWWRECTGNGMEWDFAYDDFRQCGALLGIEISGTDAHPDIFWSGFSSQGDGASFAGSYSYKAGASKAIRAHAPQDAELARIARALQAVQRKYFYSLTADVPRNRSAYYSHEMTMPIEVEGGHEVSEDDVEAVRECLRDFARWMYSQLECEYEYRMSDAVIAENIEANEYTFTAEGRREG